MHRTIAGSGRLVSEPIMEPIEDRLHPGAIGSMPPNRRPNMREANRRWLRLA